MSRRHEVIVHHVGRRERQEMADRSSWRGTWGALIGAVIGFNAFGLWGGVIGFFIGGAIGQNV